MHLVKVEVLIIDVNRRKNALSYIMKSGDSYCSTHKIQNSTKSVGYGNL